MLNRTKFILIVICVSFSCCEEVEKDNVDRTQITERCASCTESEKFLFDKFDLDTNFYSVLSQGDLQGLSGMNLLNCDINISTRRTFIENYWTINKKISFNSLSKRFLLSSSNSGYNKFISSFKKNNFTSEEYTKLIMVMSVDSVKDTKIIDLDIPRYHVYGELTHLYNCYKDSLEYTTGINR